MRQRKVLWLVPALLMACVMSACGGSGGSSEDSSAGTSKLCEPSTKTDQDATFQKTWDDLAAKAKKEGQLVIVTGVAQSEGEKKIWDCFGTKFGVKIVASSGSSEEVTSRVLAERTQKRYTVDLAMLGGSGTQRLLDTHTFADLKAQLIQPEILDRSQWYVDQVPWYADDVDQKYVSYYMGVIAPNVLTMYYNTDKVTEKDIAGLKSWNDLLDPKWKGKIVMGDASSGEDTTEQARGWLGLGEEFYDKLLRTMDPQVLPLGASRPMVDGLTRGTWDFALFIGTAAGDLDEASKQGLPVKQLTKTLEEGTWSDLSGQIGIVDQAPHPAAAQLFVNWLLSKEGQTVYNALVDPGIRTDSVSLRKDVPQGAVLDETWARLKDPNFSLIYDPTRIANAKADALAFFKKTFAELGLKP
jgi:iron(III) transport system substrate-binding protein